MKIDLGCGASKAKGFIGVDRFSLPEVDVIANLNERFPFADHSVELVFASHSLEHVPNLIFVMSEVYRVCKHKAQICIVAPYNEQKLNVANPYHLNVFNEHTPRFWTNHPECGLPPEEYFHPHAPRWGLAASDHSDEVMDLRLTQLEFFYFPQYELLNAADQREMRNQKWDVCDQIMYHLEVWKECVAYNPSFVAPSQELYIPEYVKERREETLRRRVHNITEVHPE